MIKVDICLGSRCTMFGAVDILDHIEELKEEYENVNIVINTQKCQENCKNKDKKLSPVVTVNDEVIYKATSQMVMSKIMKLISESV